MNNILSRCMARSLKMLLIFFFSLYSFSGICQTVSCLKTVDSLQFYLARNYVGWSDKVDASAAAARSYKEHTRSAFTYARQVQSNADCFFTINYYLKFFKDNHLYIKIPADTAHIETIPLNEKKLTQLASQKMKQVEGIYYTRDSVYKVAVVKSEKGLRSYAGVILQSRAPQWKAGQVKFELIKTGANEFSGTWYQRDHSAYVSIIKFDKQNGLSAEGWFKNGVVTQAEPVKPLFEEEQRINSYFKKLDDSTGYMRIKSFDLNYAKGIDSVIKANLATIQSLSRFIIDLRWNGGGGDHSMSLLKPVIYTNPVRNLGVDLITTPDNIAAWEKLIDQYRDVLPKKDLEFLEEKLGQGKGKSKAWVNFADDYTDSLPEVWPRPAKVAIVINGRCASTTEEFLLFAKQSKKVVMAGEHSMGVLDYSNVVHIDFCCPAFELTYPTTRSRRLKVGRGIDNVGVQPDIPLDLKNNNWLNELLKKL